MRLSLNRTEYWRFGIDAANGGFKAETTTAEAWNLLFPVLTQHKEVAWPTLQSLIDYLGSEIKTLQNDVPISCKLRIWIQTDFFHSFE